MKKETLMQLVSAIWDLANEEEPKNQLNLTLPTPVTPVPVKAAPAKAESKSEIKSVEVAPVVNAAEIKGDLTVDDGSGVTLTKQRAKEKVAPRPARKPIAHPSNPVPVVPVSQQQQTPAPAPTPAPQPAPTPAPAPAPAPADEMSDIPDWLR